MNNIEQKDKNLNELFEEYIDECRYIKQLRPRTIIGYQEVFQNFCRRMPEIINLHDLTPSVMTEFFRRLVKREHLSIIGLKNSTLRTYYNKLLAFFRWLEQQNYLEKESFCERLTKPPAPTYEDEKALSEKEISKIISSITLNATVNTFLYKRDMAIVNILLYTGIRKGELLGLRIQDIDFSKRTLFINAKTSKSKRSRKIPLNPTLIMHLKAYLLERHKRKSKCEYLIISQNHDTSFTEHGLKHWVEKYKKISSINFHIHRFRHTFACTLAKRNADIVSIKSVMGHSSIRMTERYLRSINSENSRTFIDTLYY